VTEIVYLSTHSALALNRSTNLFEFYMYR